ncbi:hypothetical protein [Actinoplanes aureus]|uniref:Uncharacterized protein n=1 Tax=Actinoplanes aureus TaxID=2792083 RepID=A0A931CAU9_9ACTN|nr:hypothetical protein [Actinoplanes aureus]MBG0563723.1 hypothetical protein [Actinoplanes aureus]
MTELADRFALTIGPDGRVLLALALRRRPGATTDGFARAQRYWACVPGGAQPRWLALAIDPGDPRRCGEHAEETREAADAHSAAAAYLPGVTCSGCGDHQWKPVHRAAVTRYVLTGATGGCLPCHKPSLAAGPAPVPGVLKPTQSVEARVLPAVTVRVEGPVAALLWSATGGDGNMMSSLVTDLISRNFGIRRAGGDLL